MAWDLRVARRRFGGARLLNDPIILTKLRACLDPALSYTNALAEPRDIVRHDEAR